MEIKELVESVSSSTGVEPGSVRRVLDAAFVAVTNGMGGEKPVKLEGLGIFRKKEGKEPGKSKVVFRPWGAKGGEKGDKKKGKGAKKGHAAKD
ncbi:MAG: HU family DNA-binding protein [Rhizomicrobium sp.]|jgi:nucleoid DNA-binding protein